jgi:hypothetical protein
MQVLCFKEFAPPQNWRRDLKEINPRMVALQKAYHLNFTNESPFSRIESGEIRRVPLEEIMAKG